MRAGTAAPFDRTARKSAANRITLASGRSSFNLLDSFDDFTELRCVDVGCRVGSPMARRLDPRLPTTR